MCPWDMIGEEKIKTKPFTLIPVIWKWRAVVLQHNAFFCLRLEVSHSPGRYYSAFSVQCNCVVWILWCGWELVLHSFKRHVLKIKEWGTEMWEEGILYTILILLVAKNSNGPVTPGFQFHLYHWLWPWASYLTYLCICILFSKMNVISIS